MREARTLVRSARLRVAPRAARSRTGLRERDVHPRRSETAGWGASTDKVPERKKVGVTTTPQEPGDNPDVVPSSDPDPIEVDPIAPESPPEPDGAGNPE